MPSAHQQVKKLQYIYAMEYYLPVTKKKKSYLLQQHGVRMDLESVTLSEISPSEKNKHHMISLIRGI